MWGGGARGLGAAYSLGYWASFLKEGGGGAGGGRPRLNPHLYENNDEMAKRSLSTRGDEKCHGKPLGERLCTLCNNN